MFLHFLTVQNDRYLILTAQLYDTKEMAAAAKMKADKAGQRAAQDRIRIIQQGERAKIKDLPQTLFQYTENKSIIRLQK